MWCQLIFIVAISLSGCQSERHRNTRQDERSGNGWDIRLAVPGEPGNDYPTHQTIPRTSFSCSGKAPGYYADLETNCQVFRICTLGSTYGFQSFLCPNGTLFNQAVFVCDWWMNVNCETSQQYFDNNNDKFGNLRLGPELMSDVKKMITHPMRNPYDRRTMKSNLIVMQEYIPPSSQPFPGTQLQAPKHTSENTFLPAKLQQRPISSAIKGNLVSASTPNPQYVPANRNQRPQNDAEVFQRQKQNGQYNIQSNQIRNGNGQQSGKYVHRPHHTEVNNGQYTQKNTQSGQYQSGQYSHKYQSGQYQHNENKYNGQQVKQNIVANSLSGRLVQQNNGYAKNTPKQISQQQIAPQQNYRPSAQYRQPVTTQPTQSYNTQNSIIRQNAHYTDSNNGQLSNEKQSEFGVSFSKQPVNNNQVLSQQKQPYTYEVPQLHFSNQITGEAGNEAKQNLVSNNKPTVIAKTVTFNRIIQEPRTGGPKSRITFKTWIIKPGKSAKLIAESGPYSYNRPANPTNFERLIVEPTPYYYNNPSTAAKQILDTGYAYNRPTVAAKLVVNNGYDYSRPTVLAKQVEQGYSYNKPTVAAKQVEQIGYAYNKPTAPAKQVVQTGYVYDRPTLPPTQASRLYLAPVATTPSSRLYLGPSPSPTVASRLYLAPTTARPTFASKLYIPPTTYKPLARLYIPASKQPLVVSNQYLFPQSNIQSEKLQASPSAPTPVIALPDDKPSFTLTKHSRINTNHNNLTFTDILTKEKLDITVNHIVKDTSQILGTADPQPFGKLRQADEPDDTYLPPESGNESTESINPQAVNNGEVKSSRIIQQPTSDLLPPDEEFVHINENSNKLATLPFFKEPHPTNTIERTVSLKISIPEKTAEYLFKACNDSNYDRLEILNTGSSNYLVLSNKLSKDTTHSFIPLGKLITDNISNLSDSQALVFSFLADSINQAKDYNNIAQQVTNTHTQFPTVGNDELARISNEISQLTSSQYTGNQYNVNQNNVAQITNEGNQYSTNAKYTQPEIQHAQINVAPVSQQNFKSGQYNNEVLSGQLYQSPVPEVSNIYNEPNLAKYTEQAQHTEVGDLQNELHEETKPHNTEKQNSDEVEVIHTQNSPASAPAKLQLAPTEQTDFNTQEDQAQTILDNLTKSGNGISAQLRDKIVGTISHPLQDNKLVTYKKDQSYYVYTNLEQANNGLGQFNNAGGEQSAKLTQANNGNGVSFQFIPSFSYQLEDEKEQQKLLNTFHIDEFGSPKGIVGNSQSPNTILTSNVDYTVQHPGQVNSPQTLYSGPSSYSAPQGSIGTLEPGKAAKLEQFEPNSETEKSTPAPQFRGY